MKVSDEFKLPLSVNDTYAEKELCDSNGDLVIAGRCDAHSLRVLATAANEYDQLKTDLDRAINAGAAHADRADELYDLLSRLTVACEDVERMMSSTINVVFQPSNLLTECKRTLGNLEKGDE